MKCLRKIPHQLNNKLTEIIPGRILHPAWYQTKKEIQVIKSRYRKWGIIMQLKVLDAGSSIRMPAFKKRFVKGKIDWGGYLMILPSYSIYVLFIFVPLVLTVIYSFTNYNLYKTKVFIGFTNYIRLLDDFIFITAVKNTFIYSIFAIIPPIALGLLLAVVLNGKVTGNKLCRVSVYIPYITSMVAASTIWYWIYDPAKGILNMAFNAVGLASKNWLFDTKMALGCIIVMTIWKTIGYNMIIYIAALQSVPAELYEAAKIDGATAIRKFFNITLPMLSPTTFFLFVMSCIGSFNVFEQVSIMTDGGPSNSTTTIVHQIYQNAFQQFDMGYACSMTVVLIVITLVITIVNFKYGNNDDASDMA
jgi:multiple sugar transport system permease protein